VPEQFGEAGAAMFRALGISAANRAEQIGDQLKGNRNWLLTRSPRLDGLTDDFGRREAFAPRNPRNLPARFFVNSQRKRRCHGNLFEIIAYYVL
jgi:hypothetical protein